MIFMLARHGRSSAATCLPVFKFVAAFHQNYVRLTAGCCIGRDSCAHMISRQWPSFDDIDQDIDFIILVFGLRLCLIAWAVLTHGPAGSRDAYRLSNSGMQ
jgi:hypothetical protein